MKQGKKKSLHDNSLQTLTMRNQFKTLRINSGKFNTFSRPLKIQNKK